VLATGLLPLGIPLPTRRISDPQLTGQKIQDLGRHPLQRIRQKPAEIASRGRLQAESKPVVITPQTGHQPALGVIKEKEPLQIRRRHRLAVTTKRCRFLVTEKLHRHGPQIRSCPLLSTSGHQRSRPPNPIPPADTRPQSRSQAGCIRPGTHANNPRDTPPSIPLDLPKPA
jgi:hypothetical protein